MREAVAARTTEQLDELTPDAFLLLCELAALLRERDALDLTLWTLPV